MVLIKAHTKRCILRRTPQIDPMNRLGYLPYDKELEAELRGDWFHIPSLNGYCHKSVVDVVGAINWLAPAVPIYESQWTKEARRQNDCGPTCCIMHMKARGLTLTVDDIKTADPTGLTSAPELQAILTKNGIKSVIQYRASTDDRVLKLPKYAIVLIKYLGVHLEAQDRHFTGWHWLIYLGTDPLNPDYVVTHDPDYWYPRENEGAFKRYTLQGFKNAFIPYSSVTEAITFPDLESV